MGGNATTNNNTTVIIINNNNSPDAPTKNFIATLITWLNNLVGGSPFPITGDPNKDEATLQSGLQSVETAAFLRQYNYAWDGPNTSPPSYDGGKVFQPLNDFTNVAQNQIQNISVYSTTSVFPTDSTIPQWALKKMRSDLDTWVQTVVQEPVIDGWQVTPYTRFYNDPNGKENISIDAEALYTIIQALDQNNDPQITMFLGFVGVYYGVGTTFQIVQPPKKE